MVLSLPNCRTELPSHSAASETTVSTPTLVSQLSVIWVLPVFLSALFQPPPPPLKFLQFLLLVVMTKCVIIDVKYEKQICLQLLICSPCQISIDYDYVKVVFQILN